jgi:hypothetical protein
MASRVTHLFGVPVAKLRLPETEALKQRFLPEMLRRYEAESYPRPALWETHRVHTSFEAGKADLVINFMDDMPAPYENLLRQFVHADRFEVQLWHNVYWTRAEYQERHHHIPCHFSFIHFLAFDRGEHRAPVFYDPARLAKAYCRHAGLPRDVWEVEAEIAVEEGDVLVFPSYLEHYVPPGRYTKPRVTVSMNVTLRNG